MEPISRRREPSLSSSFSRYCYKRDIAREGSEPVWRAELRGRFAGGGWPWWWNAQGLGGTPEGWCCTLMVTDGNRPSLDHRMTSLLRYQDTKDQRPMKTSPSPRANCATPLWGRSRSNNRFFSLSLLFLSSIFSFPSPRALFHSGIPPPSNGIASRLLTVVFMIITPLSSFSISICTALYNDDEHDNKWRGGGQGYRRDYVAASVIFYLLPVAKISEGYDSRGCALGTNNLW